jgi:hypothetical protein
MVALRLSPDDGSLSGFTSAVFYRNTILQAQEQKSVASKTLSLLIKYDLAVTSRVFFDLTVGFRLVAKAGSMHYIRATCGQALHFVSDASAT